jgi:hypothetical protein
MTSIRTGLLVALVAGFLAAEPAAGQHVEPPVRWETVSQTFPPLSNASPGALISIAVPLGIQVDSGLAGRPRFWPYPVIGIAAGALVGAVAGTVMMVQADEWMAPPAHVITVPAGALAGGVLGVVVGLIARN